MRNDGPAGRPDTARPVHKGAGFVTGEEQRAVDDESWRLRCRSLPVGHRHCRHGHVGDCPDPMRCPEVEDPTEPAVFLILAGPTVWVFGDERLAQAQFDVLYHGGASVQYRQNLTTKQARALIDRLPPDRRRTIEDCRSPGPGSWRRI